ncbi:hypothetical protein [Chitinimonas sp. JJ19]|uniref:hypothetical protein n=1 Tax=Chitinimonas sp. JJ19 TaxID=3109352 RepID=UPI00300286E1
MTILRVLAVVFILAGSLGLAQRSIDYTKETHAAKLGPLEFSVKETESIVIPPWLSGSAIALGVVLLLVGGKKR